MLGYDFEIVKARVYVRKKGRKEARQGGIIGRVE